MASIPVLAGITSTVIFAGSMLPMLAKAYRTRDLSSYSRGNLVMANIGNAVHSLYVYALPPGPIWALHGFYTVTSALMLLGFLRSNPGRLRAAGRSESFDAVAAVCRVAGSGEQALPPGLAHPEPGRAGEERRPSVLDVLVERVMRGQPPLHRHELPVGVAAETNEEQSRVEMPHAVTAVGEVVAAAQDSHAAEVAGVCQPDVRVGRDGGLSVSPLRASATLPALTIPTNAVVSVRISTWNVRFRPGVMFSTSPSTRPPSA